MTEQEANLRDALFAYMVENTAPGTYLVEDDPSVIERMIDKAIHQVDWSIKDHNLGHFEGWYSAKAQ